MRVIAIAGSLALVGVLVGCSESATPSDDFNNPQSDPSVSAEAEADSLSGADKLAMTDPCTLISADAVGAAVGVSDLGATTVDTEYSFVHDSIARCTYFLPTGSAAYLGDTGSDRAGVTLDFMTFSPTESALINSSRFTWQDPADLISSWTSANVAEGLAVTQLAVGLGAAQERNSIVVAVDQVVWASVSLTSVKGPGSIASAANVAVATLVASAFA